MVLGFGNPIPPAGQPGPAAAVGQRPHMDYAGMVKQSMHELATWVTAGSRMVPQPVSLTVDGYRNVFEVGDKFNIEERYGYFDGENRVTAGHSPVKMVVKYDDGSKKRVQASDLTFAIDDGKGGYKPCKLGGALGEQRRRTLIATYTDEDTGVSVNSTMQIVVTEHVAPEQTLRFKVGVEIPEGGMNDLIPPIEARRLPSESNSHFTQDLLFDYDTDSKVVSITPTYSSFDQDGALRDGWLFTTPLDTIDPAYLFKGGGSVTDPVRQDALAYYITEVLSDPDKAWEAKFNQDGDYTNRRIGEFAGWLNLQYGLVEEQNDTQIRVPDSYRAWQYSGCSSLKGFKNPDGTIDDQAEEAGNIYVVERKGSSPAVFRGYQFYNCTSLVKPLVEHAPIIEERSSGYRQGQYAGCTSLTSAADEDPVKIVGKWQFIADYFRARQYYGCTSLTTSKPEHSLDQSGTLELNKLSGRVYGEGFRSEQYAGCSSLKANGIEKMIETLTGEPSISATIRDNKYKGTQVTDAEPFYYQGNDSDEPVKALQSDVYTWHSADNKTTKYVRHYSIYGGTADTPNAITATTDSKWKSTYKENEVLQVDGLTVDIANNDGSTQRYTPPFATNMFKFEPPVGTKVHADNDHVSITYTADGTSVTTSVPITVTAA